MAAQQPARVPALVLSSTPWTGPEYRSSHREPGGVDEAEPADDGSHLTKLWHLRRPYYPADRPDLLSGSSATRWPPASIPPRATGRAPVT